MESKDIINGKRNVSPRKCKHPRNRQKIIYLAEGHVILIRIEKREYYTGILVLKQRNNPVSEHTYSNNIFFSEITLN